MAAVWKRSSVVAAAALTALLAAPSQAQFGSAFVPTAYSQEGNVRLHQTTFNLLAASFYGESTPSGAPKVSANFGGGLLSLETGFVSGKDRSFKIGGWAWNSGDRYIYELHGKYYFTPRIGVQAGALGARNRVNGRTVTQDKYDTDFFLLYNLSSSGAKEAGAVRSRNPYAVQFGLGGYHYGDIPSGRTKSATKASGFIQGSVEMKPYISIDASVWYIESPDGRQVRYGLGAGYRF